MENFPVSSTSASSFSSTSTPTTHPLFPMIHHRHPSMEGGSQNFQYSNMHEPLGYLSTSNSTTTPATSQSYYLAQNLLSHDGLQYPFLYPFLQASQSLVYPSMQPFMAGQTATLPNMSNLHPQVLSINEEKRLMDAWMTKVARSRRIMARQRSLSLSKSSSGSSSSNLQDANGPRVSGAGSNVQKKINANANAKIDPDLYTFCTPDNKRLRVLLRKELKLSDIGTLGRIVLPKREAEENLPVLFDKEGILVVIRDVYSNQEWGLKYKYWSNNKSRMYVLENTGDFVKENDLDIGDSITLYDDESKNLYVSITRKERLVAESYKEHSMNNGDTNNDNMNNTHNMMNLSDMQNRKNNVITEISAYNDVYDSTTCSYDVARDEEEASLALLIEQLKHNDVHGANSLMTLMTSMDPYLAGSTTTDQPTTATIEASSSPGRTNTLDQHFHDYYTGLGRLPEVDNTYNHIMDQIINNTTLKNMENQDH